MRSRTDHRETTTHRIGQKTECSRDPVAEAGEGKSVGVWFPDLPDCLSAGDTLDEAMLNAPEALELWAEAMIESGQKLPPPRSLTELKTALRNLRYDEGSDVAPRLKLAFLLIQ